MTMWHSPPLPQQTSLCGPQVAGSVVGSSLDELSPSGSICRAKRVSHNPQLREADKMDRQPVPRLLLQGRFYERARNYCII